MRNDLTDITLVVDRSGSMQSCQSDAQGGINRFIDEQKKEAGDAVLTLVQFDTDYEFVHKGTPIKDVPEYHLVPRGWTALLDAVGRAVNETGKRLEDTAEADRPGLVVFVIVTDGRENSSKEFTKPQVKSMVEHQQDAYQWKFIFLGADAGAFDDAASIGVHAASTAQYDKAKSAEAYGAVSRKVASMRCCASKGDAVGMSWSDEERARMR